MHYVYHEVFYIKLLENVATGNTKQKICKDIFETSFKKRFEKSKK